VFKLLSKDALGSFRILAEGSEFSTELARVNGAEANQIGRSVLFGGDSATVPFDVRTEDGEVFRRI
jgi:hypothetical protein